MSYTLQETLNKLNISKYKFDKLRQYKYLNPKTASEWNGMHYIDVLYIPKEEVNKLTPKKLDKILLKIKKEESRDLHRKWENKMYKSNAKFLHKVLDVSKSFSFYFETKKEVTDAICRGVDFKSEHFTYLGKPLKVEENSSYKVSQLGVYTFKFWENPIFDNNNLSSNLHIIGDRSYGSYIIADITVDVFEIENKQTHSWDWVYIITSMTDVKSINQECQMCKYTIKIPNGVYKYDTHRDKLCFDCYCELIKKEKADIYRRRLLSSDKTIILDFETASLNAKDGIVSISAIDMNGNILIDTKLKPPGLIDETATKLHKLTLDSLANEKTFSDIKDELVSIIKGKTVIFAHTFHWEFFIDLLKINSVDFFCRENGNGKYLYNILTMNSALEKCGLEQSPSPKYYNSLNDCKFILGEISYQYE